MPEASTTDPTRPALARFALAFAMVIALVLSLVVAPAGHADGASGVVAAIDASSDVGAEPGIVGGGHCHCPQVTAASVGVQSPFLRVTFTAYVVADDRAPASLACPPQPEPPRA